MQNACTGQRVGGHVLAGTKQLDFSKERARQMERRIFRYYCSTQVFISAVRFMHRIDGVMLQFCRSGVLTGLTGWGSSVGKQCFWRL